MSPVPEQQRDKYAPWASAKYFFTWTGNHVEEEREQPSGNRAETNQRSHHHSENVLSVQLVKPSHLMSIQVSRCPFYVVWWLCTLYGWWKTDQYSWWAQGTRTKAHNRLRVRFISFLNQLLTRTKLLLISKGVESDLSNDQRHPQSVGRFSRLPHWSKPLYHGSHPPPVESYPCHSTQWVLHHGWSTDQQRHKDLSHVRC